MSGLDLETYKTPHINVSNIKTGVRGGGQKWGRGNTDNVIIIIIVMTTTTTMMMVIMLFV